MNQIEVSPSGLVLHLAKSDAKVFMHLGCDDICFHSEVVCCITVLNYAVHVHSALSLIYGLPPGRTVPLKVPVDVAAHEHAVVHFMTYTCMLPKLTWWELVA